MKIPPDLNDQDWQEQFYEALPDPVLSAEALQRIHARVQTALQETTQQRQSPLWFGLFNFQPRLSLPALLITLNLGAIAVSLLIILFFNAPGPLHAEVVAQGSTLRIVQVNTGVVKSVFAGNSASLETGDELQTGNGTAQLTYFSGQSTILHPNTQVALAVLAREQAGTQVELNVLKGRTEHNVSKRLGPQSYFQVSSPSLVTRVHGTQFSLETRSPTETFVAVTQGQVQARRGNESITLKSGESLTAISGQPLAVKPHWLTQFIQDLLHAWFPSWVR